MHQPAKKTLVVLLTATLLTACLTTVASAARPQAPRLPAGTMLGGQVIDALAERLELTDLQRQEIRSIVLGYVPRLEVHIGEVVDGRRALFATIHQQPGTESAVRAAAGTVAEAETELAVLRAEIAGEIHQVLTPSQQDELTEAAADVRQMVDHVLEVIRSLTHLRLGVGV